VRLRAAAPTAPAAARLYRQLHLVVGPDLGRVGQDRRRLLERRRLRVPPADDRRQRLRPDDHALRGAPQQQHHDDDGRPLCPLLHVQHNNNDQLLRRLV
jgi:hypothetical protein